MIVLPLAPQGSRAKPPETFSANAQAVRSGQGAAATVLSIHVERYSADEDRDRMLKEFASGGAPALTAALRKATPVGYVEVGDKKWPIHFARQQENAKGRTILAIVDQPMFFMGGGAVNAKAREGFDVAVVQLSIDSVGLGTGSLAAAARLKAGTGPAGLELQDYSDDPIKLITVRRLIK
jgi:hypothetical protein